MSNESISFRRPFQIWHFTVSHGQLLLRSNRTNDTATRVEVLFKDVIAISLPTTLDNLLLTEASEEEVRSLTIQFGSQRLDDRKVFIARGSNYTGYVVAGAVFWHEDEGQDSDESYFQKSFLTRV